MAAMSSRVRIPVSPPRIAKRRLLQVNEALIMLLVGSVLAASIIIALGASRVGVPTLAAFLALGMLLGTDGIGKIDFENVELARSIGIIALVLILFEGGLSTSWRRLRQVAVSAALLSTIGVVVTAILTGLAARELFDLPWLQALLLGAVVSSTDAAAVFATLRYTNIKRRLARVLEAETGGNDPMAIALTVGLITWIQQPTYDLGDLSWLIIHELGLGLIIGTVLGAGATRIFSRLPASLGAFAPVASLAACLLAYGVADILGGSGFLAVYLVGLAIGSTPSRYRHQMVAFHEGMAFLSQVILFVVLGLLVFPHELVTVATASLVLAILLIILIRPLSVWISIPFSNFSTKERLLLGFAGLRGAVPIVLGTFVLSSEISHANTIFNAVFFVVLISALIQGATLERLARWLDVVEVQAPPEEDVSIKHKPIRIEFMVKYHHAIAGAMIKEVGLPRPANISLVKRNGKKLTPKSDLVIRTDDCLVVKAPYSLQPEIEDVMDRWRRRV
jgi:potassium/hydrogen antiporter